MAAPAGDPGAAARRLWVGIGDLDRGGRDASRRPPPWRGRRRAKRRRPRRGRRERRNGRPGRARRLARVRPRPAAQRRDRRRRPGSPPGTSASYATAASPCRGRSTPRRSTSAARGQRRHPRRRADDLELRAHLRGRRRLGQDPLDLHPARLLGLGRRRDDHQLEPAARPRSCSTASSTPSRPTASSTSSRWRAARRSAPARWPVIVTRDPTKEKMGSALNVDGPYVIATTSGYIGDAPDLPGPRRPDRPRERQDRRRLQHALRAEADASSCRRAARRATRRSSRAAAPWSSRAASACSSTPATRPGTAAATSATACSS